MVLFSLLLFLSLFLSRSCDAREQFIVAPAFLKEAPYPEWAHYHWVWLSNDRANQSSMMDYAMEYINHSIPVGAVNIDSTWSTGFNNFIFKSSKYPDPQGMVNYFHSHNMKIILWVTSMIDTDSTNYQEAHDKGYMLRNLLGEEALISWWHGKGGLLDYTNPQALQWWHKQMDNVLSLGIDGWKCDGTDPYVLELGEARGKAGLITRKDYSDSYYSDFFDYTRQKMGNDTLIMSRPVDALGDILYLDFSPQRVVLSGWVGDQDPTFEGLEQALKRYIQSAWAGYPNFGSDIGGYRSGKGSLGRTKELLVRWAQLGAFSPLMENGGNKEHRPWIFGNETLNIYKNFVNIHYQLVPYLLTIGSQAIENKTSSIKPLARHENFINKLIDGFTPSTYNYLLGTVILVAPIISEPPQVTVEFPKSGNGSSHWVYWFDRSQLYAAGTKEVFSKTPLDEYPVFIATGKIIPLRVRNVTSRWQQQQHQKGGTSIIKWWLFLSKEDVMGDSYEMRESYGPGIIASWRWINMTAFEINITAHDRLISFVQIEARSDTFRKGTIKIAELQQMDSSSAVVVTRYNMLKERKEQSLLEYDNYYNVIRNGGSYVVKEEKENVSSISIFPQGNKELGHSLLVSF